VSETLAQTAEINAGFNQELRNGSPATLRLVLLLGTIGSVVIAPVDAFLVSGAEFYAALYLRIGACVVFMIAFGATFIGDWPKRFARPSSLVACQVIAFEITLLTYITGGGDSVYHEALHIVMFAYALLPFPWGRWDGLLTVVFILANYNIVLFLGDRQGSLAQIISHNGLLGLTGVVASVVERVIKRNKLSDFTSRAALAKANDRLTALDTAKTRFFSNISHELRTPLTLIVAPLEAMLESAREPISAGQRERLQLAQRNALRLLRLVDDILSLTRAEAASLKLHIQRLDLADLVRTFVQDVEELAARKLITISVDVPTTPAMVEVDQTMLERILLNVFGNAAKFVNRGGKIGLTVRALDSGWQLSISDDGIGISESNLPRVFDRFYQADSGSTRSTGGTGIGLALVKEITELHGGRVWAESTLGRGTTMHIWLSANLPAACEPMAVRATPASAEPQGLPEWHQAIRNAKSYRLQGIDDATERRVAPRPHHRGDAPTILVVEDNPDMIRFLVALLAYDFNVLSAQNGKDGLRMSLERRPDLIVSDVMMPEMDGFEMARRLRQDPEGAKIPLIFLTARGSSADRVEGHAGGADTYLAKPFRSEELLAAVDALLSRQQRIRESETTHNDEAMVFMASGLLEQLQATIGALLLVQTALGENVVPSGDVLARYRESVSDVAAMVGSLRDLTTVGSKPVLAPVAIDDALRTLAASASEDLPLGKSLHVELLASVQAIITEDELAAVVRPLLDRAIAVTPIGRNIFVQTMHNRQGAAAGSVSAGAPAARTLSIVIRDEGPSLTANQIERLFFPFHSPDVDVNSALELARARRIVLTRGGTISVEPEHELGSRITVHLPVYEAVVTEAAA